MNEIQQNELFFDEQNPLDSMIFCSICQELVKIPKECSVCQNIFCEVCIENWQRKSIICPFNCAPPLKLQIPHKMILKKLNKLKYYCLNKQNGCLEKILSIDIEKHEMNCNFKEIKCKNFPICNDKMLKKDLNQHLSDFCIFEPISCERCLGIIIRKNFNEHCCLKNVIESHVNIQADLQNFEYCDMKKYYELETNLDIFRRELEKIQKEIGILKEVKWRKKSQYEFCAKGHNLMWKRKNGLLCSKCSRKGLSWFSCEECFEQFCVFCVKPKLKDYKCPKKHNLESHKFMPGQHCDFCRRHLINIKFWRDRECNFNVCEACYVSLKE